MRRNESMEKSFAAFIAVCLSLAISGLPAADAENLARGRLMVDGKAIEMTQVYAYAQPGFFDKNKQDVVVLMCDVPVPAKTVRDEFEILKLIETGKLHCVRQIINSEKQVINYEVMYKSFGMRESGGSSYHVFEAKTLDSGKIEGRSRTTSPQKSFRDIPYSYDITLAASIEPVPNKKAGTKLPSGGGALGKAYLAHNRKVLNMDIAEIKKSAPPGALENTSGDELKALLQLAVAMTPKDPEITEGYENGDQGILYVTGFLEKQKQYGTIEMAKKEGEWMVIRESWSDNP